MPPERDDPPVESGASLTVLNAMRQYQAEAKKAREPRLRQTKRNWDVFMGLRDWSHKQKGQSREATPKIAMAKEQIGAFIERGLTDFGDWYSAELANEQVMTNTKAERLLQYQLDHAASNGVNLDEDFPALVADAVTTALLGSLAILKVHGRTTTEKVFRAERGYQLVPQPDGSALPQITRELVRKDIDIWQLVIDLVPPEDYLPDPTGRSLYEGHEVERDLWEVQAMADAGVYDPRVVEQIEADFARVDEQEYHTREQDREQRLRANPSFRYRVTILEIWGSILNEKGRMVEKNIMCAMANNTYLIRPPEPNWFWHGERPFVTRPLLRVPFSTWHKALFDHAVDMNLAYDELYNLIIDGGIASVWGNRVVYPEHLDDPRQIADGIPQGMTLIAKEGTPAGAKVLEQITTGRVPQDALAVLQLTDQELQTATQVNAVRLGQSPGNNVTATAVVEAQQQSNSFFDGMIRDAEKLISKALYLGWCNTMQFLDHADGQEVVTAVGERTALALAQMSAPERYEAFAGCKFRVSGLSAVVARVRDFQKMLALLQVAGQNPIMGMSFVQRFSPQKIWAYLFKALNIDPSTLEPDEQEQAQQPQMLQMLQQQMAGGQSKQGGAPIPQEAPSSLPVERVPAQGAGGY
jgi:hypothetical protein